MAGSSSRVTLKDIAAAAGVSVMTVSYALRGHPHASRETTERVRRIAHELGYRPDPQLNRLMSYLRGDKVGVGPVIGFLNPWPEKDGLGRRSHARELLRGATARADQLGYKLEVFWLQAPGMTGRRLTDILLARGIEGLLVPPLPQAEGTLDLDWSRFAAVSMHHVEWQPGMHRVCSDHFDAMRLALRHLQELGCRRIGFVQTVDLERKVDECWLAAFELMQSRLPASRRVRAHLVDAIEREALLAWIGKEKPDGIVSVYFETVHWARAAGYKIPGDILFASLFVAEPGEHPGISQESFELGRAAVDLLAGQLRRNERGFSEHPKLMTLKARWVDAVPRSTAPSRKREGSG